jgi:hypothetical protein
MIELLFRRARPQSRARRPNHTRLSSGAPLDTRHRSYSPIRSRAGISAPVLGTVHSRRNVSKARIATVSVLGRALCETGGSPNVTHSRRAAATPNVALASATSARLLSMAPKSSSSCAAVRCDLGASENWLWNSTGEVFPKPSSMSLKSLASPCPLGRTRFLLSAVTRSLSVPSL